MRFHCTSMIYVQCLFSYSIQVILSMTIQSNPPLKSVDGSLDPMKMVSTYMSSVSSNRYTLIDMMLALVRDGSTCMSADITLTQV